MQPGACRPASPPAWSTCLASGKPHPLDAVRPAGRAERKILVVHFFERAGKRLTGRMRPGHLGFSLLSHTTPKVDIVAARALAAGFEVFTPPCVAEIDGETRELVILKGPNEELLELVGDVG